jgi:hypothetical protein
LSKGVAPLLNLLALEVGESLPSFFIRLSNRKYDPSPEWLLNLCQKHLSRKDIITCPTQAKTYGFLTELTQVNSVDLYKATPHCFADIISPAANKPNSIMLPSGRKVALLEPSILSQHTWSENAAQFCPHCLKEGPYHRLSWMLQAVSVCLEHHCLLVQCCTGCNTKLRIQDVVNRYCDWCAFDLSKSPTLTIAEDECGLLSQRVIQSWFGITVAAVSDDSLPKHPASTLYKVTFGLYRAIRAIRNRWDYLYDPFDTGTTASIFPCRAKSQLTSLKSYLLHATALKGLFDWPNGFCEFLNAYRLRDRRVPTDIATEDLGYIYSIRTHRYWQHPEFRFLRQALGKYLQENYQYSFALKQLYRLNPHGKSPVPLEYISEAEAAKILQLPPLIVKRLVQLEYLTGYQPPKNDSTLRRFNLVRHQDLLELQKNWQDVIPLADVARLLGVSEETTLDLAMVGLINGVQNSCTDDYHQVKISIQSLAEFIERLQQGVVHLHMQRLETISLAEVMQRESGDSVNMIFLIEGILAGELRAFWPSEISDLAHLVVSREDLKRLT